MNDDDYNLPGLNNDPQNLLLTLSVNATSSTAAMVTSVLLTLVVIHPST